jgi:uncharacterized protein (TIGR02646 family)
MLHLPSKNLSKTTQDYLSKLQKKVDDEVSFEKKAAKAKSLWESKHASKAGKEAFNEIREVLETMCVGKRTCNYCEHDRAFDIEHIYPKSLYPSLAFVWENYLLACKGCNSAYKLDQFAIFKPKGSNLKHILVRNSEPDNDDSLLINPRNEDPTVFLRLNLVSQTFFYDPMHEENTREYMRADYTAECLELNKDEELIVARKNHTKTYLERLQNYLKAKESSTFDDLDVATNGFPSSDRTQPFEDEKQRILENIRNSFKELSHPTVWFELKRQRAKLPKTNQLFNQLPEALDW